jgi:hypothetical protein
MSIRSFLYLDEYKLYSFSSQLFKGMTEHTVHSSGKSREHKDQHERISDKARLVAEIASEQTGFAEKKFLHDHAYSLFERELELNNSILNVTQTSELQDFSTSRFIRISGPAVVFDAKLAKNTITRVNELADALAYVININSIGQARAAVQKAADATNDKNKQSKLDYQSKKLTPQFVSKQMGMRQDEQFIKQLALLLDYGLGDLMQLQIPIELRDGNSLLFSAPLKREALREPETLIIQKYSRLTDRTLTIVGIPTQAGKTSIRQDVDARPPKTIKEMISFLMSHLSLAEEQFTGRLENEVILDPIAIYADIEFPDNNPNDNPQNE